MNVKKQQLIGQGQTLIENKGVKKIKK